MSENCFDAFDRIYLINLERRKDRLATWFENNLLIRDNIKLEVFKAIDGKTRLSPNFNGTSGALGCLESHLSVLKDAKKNGYRRILVFEDDCKMISGFETLFSQGWRSLPENWDMLYLFANDHTSSIPLDEYISKCTASLSTVSYAVQLPILSTLIGLLEKRTQPVDVVYGHLHFLINAYRFSRNLVDHHSGYSDVEEKNTMGTQRVSLIKKIVSKVKHLRDKYV